jgi:hypothetical protein
MQFDRHAKLAFALACIVLLATGIGFRASVKYLRYYLRKEAVELRMGFSVGIPRVLDTWKAVGEDQQLDAAVIEELGTSKYLERTYALDGDPRRGMLNVHLAYYTGMIDSVPHVPDRCLTAAGFNQVTQPSNFAMDIDDSRWHPDSGPVNAATNQPYPMYTFRDRYENRVINLRMPLDEFELRVTEFQLPDKPQARIFAGYFFIANGRTTPNPTGVRKLAFDRTNKYAYYCKVQFTQIAGKESSAEEFVSLSTDLLNELLPELMRCLPDWAEVEARERAEEAGSGPTSPTHE